MILNSTWLATVVYPMHLLDKNFANFGHHLDIFLWWKYVGKFHIGIK